MSKKIGKYAVIVVLYIALVSTLAFIMSTISLIVNADSSTGFSTWKNAYASSSIEIATSNGSIICGSNDVFESNSSNDNVVFDDYYSVVEENGGDVPTDLTNYLISVPSGWSAVNSYGKFYINGTVDNQSISRFFIGYAFDFRNDELVSTDDSIYTSSGRNIGYSESFLMYVTGGTDVTNESLIMFFVNSGATFTYNHSGGASLLSLSNIIPLATSSDDISIKRTNTATYNSNGYYDVVSSIDSDIITNFYLSFTRDFVVKYSDFSSGEYRYDYQATDEFVITKGYYLNYYDVSGVLQRVNINSSMSYDSNDIVSLLPTLSEITLEIGEDNINQSDIYLIEDLYVQISCPLTSGSSNVHTFYWVGVNNSRYSTIVNDLPNQFWKTTEFNVGEFLLDSVNSFLSFELIPGFSLLSLLALVIGIPLLIYILKLFLGG